MRANCTIHRNLPLTHFCQTCSDVICEHCYQRQPHSGQTHKVRTLEDSANIRRNHYVHYLRTQIHPLRSKIEDKISALTEIAKQYESEKQIIEKDITIEYEAIENRLKAKVQKIIYQKQTQIKHHEMFINKLDDLTEAYEKSFQHPQAFLLAYEMFDSQIRKLESIQANNRQKSEEENEVTLERQISQTYQKIATLPQYEENNKFINKVIDGFIKNFKKELKIQKEKAQQKGKKIKLLYNETCLNLVKDKKAKICVFCGVPFSIDAVNEACGSNRTYKMKPIYNQIQFTLIVPEECRGSKRHFWYISNSEHRQRPDLNTHSLLRKNIKKNYLNALTELEQLKYVIREYEIIQGKEMEEVFREYDHEKVGAVTKVAFSYIMTKIFNATQPQTQNLIGLLSNGKNIQYKKLRELLDNPTEDYFNFLHEEEQMEKAKPVGPNSGSLISKFRY